MTQNVMQVHLVATGREGIASGRWLANLLSNVSRRPWRISGTTVFPVGTSPDDYLSEVGLPESAPGVYDYDELWVCSPLQLPNQGEWQLLIPGQAPDFPSRRYVRQLIDPFPTGGNTLEMFVHRVEDQMSRHFGSWNTAYRSSRPYPMVITPLHDWDWYTLNATHEVYHDGQLIAGRGNAHTAPNGHIGRRDLYGEDYNWGEHLGEPGLPPIVQPEAAILSNCYEWGRNYPLVQRNSRLVSVTRETWGRDWLAGTYRNGGLTWWLSGLPRGVGSHDWEGRDTPNNWWTLVANTFG